MRRIAKHLKLAALTMIVTVAAMTGICPAADTIRINGSGSGLDMLKPMIAEYTRSSPGTVFKMDKPMGSSGAVKALQADFLDIVVTSKPLKPEDAAAGARLQQYGRTPLAIITEKKVPKSDISTGELEDIYAGRSASWPNGETIRVVLRPKEDIDTNILRGLSDGMDKAISAAQSRPGMIMAVTDPDAGNAVSRTPGGLGANGLTSIIVGKLPLKTLTLNGVKASPGNLANGSYPLAKEIDFITTSRTPAAALKFIAFVYSPKGRAIAEKAGVLVTAPQAKK